MTAPEKGRWYWFKNWLHYHWLYLIIAAVALWVGISWLGNALHWGETLPDYQIAYVGKSALPFRSSPYCAKAASMAWAVSSGRALLPT